MQKESGYLITAYPSLFKKVIYGLKKPFNNKSIDKIMALEAKGLFYGPTIAYELNKPFITIFKSGRIPKQFVVSKRYKDYSKKLKSLDIGKVTLKKGDKILLIDDVFDTGQSARTAISLIESLGGKVIGVSIVYNKLNKENEEFFKKYNFHYLVKMKNF